MADFSVFRVLFFCFVFFVLFTSVEAKKKTKFVREEKVLNPNTGSNVSVQYTEQNVPFITADTEQDLFFTQGKIVAQNRIWQMDFFRRFMLGTLSEVFGNITLQSDINHRRMQWVKICLQNIENTPQSYLNIVGHYVDGVNAFLDEAAVDASLLPPEFTQYDVPFPAPFAIVDTFLVLKALAVGLSGNANDEVPNQKIVDETSLERFIELQSRDLKMPFCLPPYFHSDYSMNSTSNLKCSTYHSTSSSQDMFAWSEAKTEEIENVKPDWILTNEEVARQRLHNRENPSELEKFLTSFASEPTRHASNNWAVSGNFTDTGFPLVCNDPHLPYTAPMVWYLMGLDVTDPTSKWQNLVGANVVMAPGIGLGRNNHLAWGYTTDHADTQDIYLMKNTADNKGYYYRNQYFNYEISEVQIVVKGASTVTETLINSVYGPVVVNDDDYYSVSFTGFNETDGSIMALIDSNTATDLDEFRTAMSKWWSLLFNAAYGDLKGNILFQAVGAIPIRKTGDTGYLPKVGDGSMDWIGITAWEDMPHSINLSDGFVVTANNPLGRLNQLSHPFEGTYVPGFRAQRIIDLLLDEINAGNLITVDYVEQIQGDVTDLVFSYLYPALKNLDLKKSIDLEYQQKLLAWNGTESLTSTLAPIFDSWLYCMYNVTFYEIGAATQNPHLMLKWFGNPSPSGSGGDISCSYWNQTCSQYTSSCFSSAVQYYVTELGLPEWGSIHEAVFLHLPPTPLRWNRVTPVGGSHYVPNAATFTVTIPGISFEAIVGGPSVRLVSDLSGTTPTQLVMPMGQSGDPHSDHYDDMLDLWANLQYLTLDWSDEN